MGIGDSGREMESIEDLRQKYSRYIPLSTVLCFSKQVRYVCRTLIYHIVPYFSFHSRHERSLDEVDR